MAVVAFPSKPIRFAAKDGIRDGVLGARATVPIATVIELTAADVEGVGETISDVTGTGGNCTGPTGNPGSCSLERSVEYLNRRGDDVFGGEPSMADRSRRAPVTRRH